MQSNTTVLFINVICYHVFVTNTVSSAQRCEHIYSVPPKLSELGRSSDDSSTTALSHFSSPDIGRHAKPKFCTSPSLQWAHKLSVRICEARDRDGSDKSWPLFFFFVLFCVASLTRLRARNVAYSNFDCHLIKQVGNEWRGSDVLKAAVCDFNKEFFFSYLLKLSLCCDNMLWEIIHVKKKNN